VGIEEVEVEREVGTEGIAEIEGVEVGKGEGIEEVLQAQKGKLTKENAKFQFHLKIGKKRRKLVPFLKKILQTNNKQRVVQT